ncbi:hypothetical protein ACJMK2_042346 [Sinanodonta woodiana]|uniref:Uncharacterized protein n=1 Tax=Sinanodonta woodiana TaxID=1069815 RepID=A0ABD3W732_SINWO
MENMTLKRSFVFVAVFLSQNWIFCKEVTYTSYHYTASFTPHEMFQDLFPLTQSNFTEKVLHSPDPWVVVVHDGSLEKVWKTMAAGVRGIIWVGMIDKRTEQSLLQEIDFTESENSVARVYPYGAKSTKERKWKSASSPNEARALAVNSLPDRTYRIKDGNLRDFLIESFMSKPSKFPVLIVTDEQEALTLHKALAVRYEKYFIFGRIVKPGPDELQKLGLTKIYFEPPAIFVLLAQRDNKIVSDNFQFSTVQYDKLKMGEMNYTNIIQFLFAVNGQYRYLLPGTSLSDQKTEAEMEDILQIEGQRFQITFSDVRSASNGSKKAMPTKEQKSDDMKFEFKKEIHYGDSSIKDEL